MKKRRIYMGIQMYFGLGGIMWGLDDLHAERPLKIIILFTIFVFVTLLMDIRALLAWPEQAREELER